MAGLAYVFIGMETKGKSLETIEQALDAGRPSAIESAKTNTQDGLK